MKTSFISNITVQTSMRSTIAEVQAELIKSQKEVVTGRLANIGEELGGITSRSLNLHRDLDMLKNLQNTNSVVDQRMSASQAALSTMSASAQTGMEAMIALSGANDETLLAIAAQTLKDALDSFTDSANSSMNGEYLFSGINTDVKPLNDYFDPAGSPAKASFDSAFLGFFGFAQSDPLAANITVTQMDDFLTNVVEPLFDSAQWNTDWSNATDTKMSSRISRNEVVNSSTTVNESGARRMALAAVVGLELINSPINRQVRQQMVERTISYFGEAISGLDYERGQLGLSQARVKTANESISVQLTIVETNINGMEGVDVYEASTRMTSLMTQMEISYSLTARISQLSLVNMLK
jgi:flagellar hook-associated protein 3 FlgL